MTFIQGIRKNLLYFSITIPLVLIGYEFLMFTTSANRGWFFLFTGQILVVPVVYIILSLLFSRLFNGSQWSNVIGLVFLILFSIGVFIAMPIALEETNKFK
jgi:hypothetical protein